MDDIAILLHDNQLDVLCLSETWLTDKVLDQFLVFPGYSVLRRDRRGRRGGGVAILHRSEMNVTQLTMPPDGPLETLWVSATWRGGRPTTVGVVYRPPDRPVKSSLEHLHDQLSAALCAGRPVILLGDVNLDVLNHTSGAQVRRHHQ